ncbi:MAG: T9SS type A sorting domain-containing protein [Bacteroidia bacterium]
MLRVVFLFIAFVLLSVAAKAQEVLTPLGVNYQLRQLASSMRVSNQLDTINLPFVDDFSSRGVFPSHQRWTDRHVFINTDMADNPPTIGVATFDGLDEFGEPYDISSPTAVGLADQLSSQAINLGADSPADSVYLSFFFQPAGLCDPPESNDSLSLEFFGSDSSWNYIWGVKGSMNRPFQQRMIPVRDSLYFHPGFRFRFKSTGSLTGNVDVWHLDYVRLNRNRNINDTAFTDVAYQTKPKSVLNLYQDIPVHQYFADPVRFREVEHGSMAHNLGDNRNVAYKYTSINKTSGAVISDIGFQSISFPMTSTANFSFPTFPLNLTQPDPFVLETTFLLSNTPDFLPTNDTARRTQHFTNYFAYDDGTAETGYGLNIIGGSVAYKFYLARPDTVWGMWMYFTQAAENAALELFNLKVWSFIGEGGFSGNESELTSQDLLRPLYGDSLGEFIYYALDTPVYVRDSFYVGWQQLSPRLINIGLDRNHQIPGVKWFNVQGQWVQSQIPGSWMIRPVMGDVPPFPASVKATTPFAKRPVLYPNPARERVFIRHEYPIREYQIRDLQGRIIVQQQFFDDTGIDLGGLAPGMYLIALKNALGQAFSEKLIIR